LSALAVAITSSLSNKFLISIRPFTIEPKISALWEIDLSPGTKISPLNFGVFSDDIEYIYKAAHN
jgi:hypothetical protein